MSQINLLPIEFQPNAVNLKILATIKKITIILGVALSIFSLIGIVFIIFQTRQVNSSIARRGSLKQKIGALEATEQKLFLIKDRISKVKLILSEKNSSLSFDSLNQTLANLPQGVFADAITIGNDKTKFSVVSASSLSMASFINSLVVTNLYKSLTLKNFVFAPERGFLITLEGTFK